jgi:hypothetical protein
MSAARSGRRAARSPGRSASQRGTGISSEESSGSTSSSSTSARAGCTARSRSARRRRRRSGAPKAIATDAALLGRTDVREVLQPLEVRDDDAARVQVDVRDHQHAALPQQLVGLRRRRAVRALGHDTGADARMRSRRGARRPLTLASARSPGTAISTVRPRRAVVCGGNAVESRPSGVPSAPRAGAGRRSAAAQSDLLRRSPTCLTMFPAVSSLSRPAGR